MATEIRLDHDGEALLTRHADWWAGRGSALVTVLDGAPLGDLWLPLADGSEAAVDLDIAPDILDLDRLAGEQQPPGPLATWGDLFRTVSPYGRVPWVEAILGAPIRATIQGGSMRTRAFVEVWAQWEGAPTHLDDAWFDLLLRLIDLLIARSNGRFAVVQPLMRGPSDLAEAVLGPELMSFSMIDHPESLRRFLDEVTHTFIDVLHAVLDRVPTVAGGYVSPFGIWAPGTVVRTQCDATAFLAPQHYAQWYLPYDTLISESVDYSIIHLHSCSLHTVEPLLAVARPHAIQITLETAPGPTLVEMLPTLRKILDVKPLLLEGPMDDAALAWLLDALPNGGLAITARRAPW